jgi:hypothetical protein
MPLSDKGYPFLSAVPSSWPDSQPGKRGYEIEIRHHGMCIIELTGGRRRWHALLLRHGEA